MNADNAAPLEVAIREMHQFTDNPITDQEFCENCGQFWPCDAIQAADLIARLRADIETQERCIDRACACFWTPESTWFRYGSAVEPGSQREHNPLCTVHPASDAYLVEAHARLRAEATTTGAVIGCGDMETYVRGCNEGYAEGQAHARWEAMTDTQFEHAIAVGRCTLPPDGWWCSLPDGHVGPCPTRECPRLVAAIMACAQCDHPHRWPDTCKAHDSHGDQCNCREGVRYPVVSELPQAATDA